MNKFFILLIIGIAAFFFFRSRPVPPIDTSSDTPPTQTPAKVSQTPKPVTITELLEPLYANVFNHANDSNPIADSATDLATVSSLLQAQPNSPDAATTQILASSRLLCALMQQAVNETNQARNRMQANQSGHRTQNTQFFDAMNEQKWRASLAQFRNQATPVWTRLQQLESSHPVPILAAPAQTVARSILTARRELQSNRQREAARATAEAAREAAREAAEPPPRVSRSRRLGLGGD